MDIEKHAMTNEEGRMEKINILIVDKQPIFRQGIQQALSSHEDIDVVGECSPDDNTWSLVENILPDITLVDLSTTPVTEFDVARKIATRCPKVAVVILAPNPDDDHLFQAIKSGAVAFLSRDASADELADTLRQVRRGEYPICLLYTSPSPRD